MQRGQPDDTERSIKNGGSGFERGYEAARRRGGSTGATGATGETGTTGETGRVGPRGGLSTGLLAVLATVIIAGFGALYQLGQTVSDVNAKLDRNLSAITAGQERNNDAAEIRQRAICIALKDLTTELRIRENQIAGGILSNPKFGTQC